MSENATSFWSTPKGWAALGLIGAATYFLLMEHRQHVWQYLPFIILLACPFMHVFMAGTVATEHQWVVRRLIQVIVLIKGAPKEGATIPKAIINTSSTKGSSASKCTVILVTVFGL